VSALPDMRGKARDDIDKPHDVLRSVLGLAGGIASIEGLLYMRVIS
jgi:hypothetical protein